MTTKDNIILAIHFIEQQKETLLKLKNIEQQIMANTSADVYQNGNETQELIEMYKEHVKWVKQMKEKYNLE